MNKIGMVVRDLYHGEQALAQLLLRVAERHRADHEVYHLARRLADWSHRHVRELAVIGREHGQELDPDPRLELGLADWIREKGGELTGLTGRRPEPGLQLLRDLREVYVLAAGVGADWVILGQAAKAVRDGGLLDLVQRCQPANTRQTRWANAKLKDSSPQILAS
jgi:hypothetical protein